MQPVAMPVEPSWLTRCAVLALMLASLTSNSNAQPPASPLPETQPLTIREPLDEVMVAGISRFTLRQLAESPSQRQDRWARDYSSLEAYNNSVATNRARFRAIIGAVDPREAPSGFEIVAKLGQDGVVARSDAVVVYAVRWPVLRGVTAEGLLVQPRTPPLARVVALPDADWTPEMLAGMQPGIGDHEPIALRLAASGFQVVVPTLISRSDAFSGSPLVAFTNQPHREFLYRQSFQMGRHIIGYEVAKVEAAVDELERLNQNENIDVSIGVAGVGEGGLLALYTAAVDPRIDAALVSGYFQSREAVWQEPIYRNVWSLLTEFGDAEIASLIAPRPLVIEACAVPEIAGPPPAREGRRNVAAPGRIETCSPENVRAEYDRAKQHFNKLGVTERIVLVTSSNGTGPSGTPAALAAFRKLLATDNGRPAEPPTAPGSAGASRSVTEQQSATPRQSRGLPSIEIVAPNLVDATARERRQFDELVACTQQLMRRSEKVRDEFWSRGDRSSVDRWQTTAEFYRNYVWEEMIGKLPAPTMPPNVRTRRVLSDAAYTGYEVVIDVYPDVIAAGILLLPKDLKPTEKRPVVVCQHGLEGTPMDTITRTGGGYSAYKSFAAELAKRGFIVYAPQNPYRGEDRFRVIQRQANPLKLSLFSFIIRQHERTVEWLSTLSQVDSARIGFYGLSYGGKTAVRVPPILDRLYALSVCSADFNEWIRKIASVDDRYSYLYTPEYEMPEWNMAHVANYAELASLMSPRPFMVERGHDDGVAPDEWVAAEYAKVRRHYAKLNLADRTEIEFFNGPHTIHGERTFEFLHRHLNWPRQPNN